MRELAYPGKLWVQARRWLRGYNRTNGRGRDNGDFAEASAADEGRQPQWPGFPDGYTLQLDTAVVTLTEVEALALAEAASAYASRWWDTQDEFWIGVEFADAIEQGYTGNEQPSLVVTPALRKCLNELLTDELIAQRPGLQQAAGLARPRSE